MIWPKYWPFECQIQALKKVIFCCLHTLVIIMAKWFTAWNLCQLRILCFLLTMFPGPPATLRALSVSFLMPGQQFTITWDEPPMNMGGTIDAYFVNITGPNDLCGNVNTLQRVTERSYTCSGWTMSTGQTYTFTLATAKCGGALIGPASDPVTVSLHGMLLQVSCVDIVTWFLLCI